MESARKECRDKGNEIMNGHEEECVWERHEKGNGGTNNGRKGIGRCGKCRNESGKIKTSKIYGEGKLRKRIEREEKSGNIKGQKI